MGVKTAGLLAVPSLLLIASIAILAPRFCGAATPELTPEQRKQQAYAERQYNRGRMAIARGQVKVAKRHYVEAIKTYEKHFGKNDERLIDPLEAQVQLYAGPMQKPNKKQRALLERLLGLYDTLEKPGLQRATVMAQLGDWWITAKDGPRAADYYREAWEVIAGESGAQKANAYFSKAKQLFFEPPVYRPRKPSSIGHTTVVSYSIDPAGRVRDMVMVDSDSPPDITGGLTKALKKRRYRPVVVDGVPALVTGVKISFNYSGNGGTPVEELVPP